MRIWHSLGSTIRQGDYHHPGCGLGLVGCELLPIHPHFRAPWTIRRTFPSKRLYVRYCGMFAFNIALFEYVIYPLEELFQCNRGGWDFDPFAVSMRASNKRRRFRCYWDNTRTRISMSDLLLKHQTVRSVIYSLYPSCWYYSECIVEFRYMFWYTNRSNSIQLVG